jgi:hypothetical protein
MKSQLAVQVEPVRGEIPQDNMVSLTVPAVWLRFVACAIGMDDVLSALSILFGAACRP